MRVSSVIYAEEVMQENTGNGSRNHIINPLGILLVPFTPATFTFVIAVSFIDLTKIDKDIYIRFKKQGDTAHIVEMGPINIPSNLGNTNIPLEYAGLNLNLNLRNVILPTEGEYVTEIIFDGNNVGEYPINVVKGVNQIS